MLRLATAFAAASAILAAPAFAQPTNDGVRQVESLNALYACAEITDDAARLVCYDNAAGRIRQAQTDGSLVAVDRAQVQEMERESFGFSLPSLTSLLGQRPNSETERPDYIDLEVERVIRHGDGSHTFVMTDGQRWTQIEIESANNVRTGDSVRVRRAALGSYMLVSSRGGSAHRVRRVG